ncbi:hypothetical protein [Rhodococcus chondri]|uniref:Uncharacterized protein n=1 Tax=Rhodococcus chondri TaxID=3065941 RepID=A0ABU7JM58_9NOCA|nr:hypothetical protein [Rhodococcus sp. CC-R104]MEE2031112.1 hypothetical protein [Rhodococcus sp. CC-R104]
MTTAERHPMIPVAPPSLIEDFYTPEEIETIFSVIRQNGPWRLILAHHFSSTEEYLAISGGNNRKADATLSDFVAPVFRGFFGNEGVVFYPELQDIYFGSKLLDTAKSLHGAKYGMVHDLLFNLSGPSHSFDAGHFDTAVFRGMGLFNTPIWLLAIMSKCGLFDEWEVKSAQVLTYFNRSDIDGGFTYWPDGPDEDPARISAPFWNTAFLTDNSRMYHRREGNGARDQRDYPELDITTELHSTPDGQWSIRNGDKEIRRFGEADMRMLVHYTALLFDDLDDVRRYQDHTDDLTREKVFGMLIDDMRAKGTTVEEPSDPMNDTAFVARLTEFYKMAPSRYPADAPLDVQ